MLVFTSVISVARLLAIRYGPCGSHFAIHSVLIILDRLAGAVYLSTLTTDQTALVRGRLAVAICLSTLTTGQSGPAGRHC